MGDDSCVSRLSPDFARLLAVSRIRYGTVPGVGADAGAIWVQ